MSEHERDDEDREERVNENEKPSLDEQKSDERRVRTGGTGVQQPEREVVDRNIRHGRKPHP